MSNPGSQRQLVCRAASTPSCQVGATARAEEKSGAPRRPVTLQCEVTSRFRPRGNLEVKLSAGKRVIGANFSHFFDPRSVFLKRLVTEAITLTRLFQLLRTGTFYGLPSFLSRGHFFSLSLTAQFLFNRAVKCMKASPGAACGSSLCVAPV